MIPLLILEMEPWLCALWCSEYLVRAAHTVVYWQWTTKTGCVQPHYFLTQSFPSTWCTYAEKHTAACEGEAVVTDHRTDMFDSIVTRLLECDYLLAFHCRDDKWYFYSILKVFPLPIKTGQYFHWLSKLNIREHPERTVLFSWSRFWKHTSPL